MLAKVSKIGWYWHRLWAMSPGEILLRFQKKSYQRADSKGPPKFSLSLQSSAAFPVLPNRSVAPPELLDGLRASAAAILRGDWLAFGHLPLKVDDPPSWHRDYLVGKDLRSAKPAFQCDHRAQPGGADIKIIWEPSRWYQIVRLAMAAWLLDDTKAQEKCIALLHDWNKNNPAFTGLNWTSGLEVGMRLVNFTWIDAFLAAAGVPHKTLQDLRQEILPPHIWYAWRYKSFGSSANNHLLGELAGLILALARWPELATISANLKAIAEIFEREVLLQFAPDGGNNEQALGYHLFSWEFCWQSQLALESAGIPVSPEIKDRLRRAGKFYAALKPENATFDFGDSDNAYVTPLFANEQTCAAEWHRWFQNPESSPSLNFWFNQVTVPVGDDVRSPSLVAQTSLREESPLQHHSNQWLNFPHSGYAILRTADWFLRFDLSPLGYLSMAPHGHLDALHVSIWFRDEPVIIDPGTGAYYADKTVRSYFADWAAHNSPHLRFPPQPYPKRFGTFLWDSHHKAPSIRSQGPLEISAELELPYGRAIRTISFLAESNSIRVTDQFARAARVDPQAVVTTRWKFAPDITINSLSTSDFSLKSPCAALRLSTSPEWTGNSPYNPPNELRGKTSPFIHDFPSVNIESLVSPAFRALAVASYLNLESSAEGPFSITISPT